MSNIDKLIKSIEENRLEKYRYFGRNGKCLCALGHAYSIVGVSFNYDSDINRDGIEEFVHKEYLLKLNETFPEVTNKQWFEIQIINDTTPTEEERKEEIIKYLKNIKECKNE